MEVLKGSCLCGKVKLEVADEFKYMGNCHCSECRKFTGSDYSSAGGIALDKLLIIQGKEDIQTYQKSENTMLCFCRHCGSSLYSKKNNGIVNIRLGILDDTPSHKPDFHIFVASKALWLEISDNVTQFDAGPK
ncbi:GFA family protein [Vibrio alginolyticus]|nr:GFA family protein [Vibrio alginolyticus]ELN6937066.1 GFA family protein [Vibrio alginolyticus]